MSWRRALDAYGYALLWGVPALLCLWEGGRISATSTLVGNWASGPGGYLTLVGLLLAGFAVYEATRGLRRAGRGGTHPSGQSSAPINPTVWRSFLLMAGYILLVPWLGFILATGVFLVPAMRLLDCSARSIAATALVICLLIYWVLPPMGISLPRGPLGF